ncbi:MAG: F0F1 ATP synthase subunit B [Bacteroidetes bacterium]|nr:F0F1 ATP synthase subunit B [Bacteroidota bacterium]
MELVSPGLGLVFWMTLSFLALLFILKKFAWKPILKALKEREVSIHEALKAADRAKAEMEKMQLDNEALLREAKNERDKILADARKVREVIIEEARQRASEEGNRIIQNARESIEYEKMAAMTGLKNELAQMSIEISEKVIRRELADKKNQQEYIRQLLSQIDQTN